MVKIMRACSSASGGVMFIPDEIERKSEPVSYNDLVEGQDVPKNKNSSPLLGKIKSVISSLTKAA